MKVLVAQPNVRKKLWAFSSLLGREGITGPGFEDLKRRLMEIRKKSVENFELLQNSLRETLKDGFLKVRYIRDAAGLKELFENVSSKFVLMNDSVVLGEEVVSDLERQGFIIKNSYTCFASPNRPVEGKRDEERVFRFLPFDPAKRWGGLDFKDLLRERWNNIEKKGSKDVTALLGVCAASADGTVLLVQHLDNVAKAFVESRNVVLFLPLERIVWTEEEAFFVAEALFAFGLEALSYRLRFLSKRPSKDLSLTLPSIPPEKTSREIWLAIWDNGRKELADTEFGDYLLCLGCRACDAACPVSMVGGTLSPNRIVRNTKFYLEQVGEGLLDGEAEAFPSGLGRIEEDSIWSCSFCLSCTQICPLELRPSKAVRALRQNLVLISTTNPSSKRAMVPLRNLRSRDHPYGALGVTKRELRKVFWDRFPQEGDFLLWTGCMASVDIRMQKVALDFASIMQSEGISLGVLREENCCGEPARAIGDPFLFEELAVSNVRAIEQGGFSHIVTLCPHCFDVLKNEYTRLGLKAEVLHHSQFLYNLFGGQGQDKKEGRPGLTYHDPCYLGRHNGVYEEPRAFILSRGFRLFEMDYSKERSFCCGAGGGRVWLSLEIQNREAVERFRQAMETKANLLVTACPYCLTMLEDARKSIGASMEVLDIVELFKVDRR